MRSRHRRRLMAQINVVPYIDVSLVLLIIFMITAPLLTRGVKIDVPQAPAQPLKEQQQPLVLGVDKKGNLYLNVGVHPNQPLKPEMVFAMAKTVIGRNPNIAVLVRGDANASYDKVVYGMALLERAGAKKIQLVTKSPKFPFVTQSKQ